MSSGNLMLNPLQLAPAFRTFSMRSFEQAVGFEKFRMARSVTGEQLGKVILAQKTVVDMDYGLLLKNLQRLMPIAANGWRSCHQYLTVRGTVFGESCVRAAPQIVRLV